MTSARVLPDASRKPPWRLQSAALLRSSGALIVLFLLAIVFSPTALDGSNIFLQPGNLTDVLRQVSVIGIIALAMTYVILTGGIDLSVGSILALSSCVVAMYVTRAQGSASAQMAVGILFAALAGAATGALNGIVLAVLNIQPFIVTLAAMIGVRGFTKWLSGNANVDIGFGEDLAASFAELFRQKAVVVGCYAASAAIFWVVLERTVFGRHVRAIGDNPKAAKFAGLPVRGTRMRVYLLSGLMSGIAGVLYAAQNHQGNPNAGVAYELDAIAAVVIGGTRLAGGKGSIGGTILGTLIMGLVTNMLRLNNVDSNLEMVLKAVIILIAVAVQRERNDS